MSAKQEMEKVINTFILIGVEPKQCSLLIDKKSSYILKKFSPQKEETPFVGYIYCIKKRGEMLNTWEGEYFYDTQDPYNRPNPLCGKVIGKFICDRIERYSYNLNYNIPSDVLRHIGLPIQEIKEYGKGQTLYGWHIQDLEIYKEPKKISDFYKKEKNPCCMKKNFRCSYDNFDYFTNSRYCGIDGCGDICPYKCLRSAPSTWVRVNQNKDEKTEALSLEKIQRIRKLKLSESAFNDLISPSPNVLYLLTAEIKR